MTAVTIERGGDRRLQVLPRRWLVVGAVLPLLLVAAWAGIALTRGGSTPVGPLVGQQAPDFALADLNGNPLQLSDLRGRAVIVNFWASWCVPCADEFPVLGAAAQGSGDPPLVVGIVYRDSSSAAAAFMARMHATWPAAMDPGERVASAYGVYGAPASFFIDAHGVVRGRQLGQLTMADVARHLTATYAGTSGSR
ncbi:MAG TPA: redoxin domain-containing protein [Candidatus Limnocylindria bacterium]|nr:redoxin domain-containing protein [Candidatus Limnocylindria bacterium]